MRIQMPDEEGRSSLCTPALGEQEESNSVGRNEELPFRPSPQTSCSLAEAGLGVKLISEHLLLFLLRKRSRSLAGRDRRGDSLERLVNCVLPLGLPFSQ